MKLSQSTKLTQVYESPLTDNLTALQRSDAMRKVKSKNTSPELQVRRSLRQLGKTGYRLHRRDIPGNPDIAWVGRKVAIFINGCFWHGHDCPRGARVPKTRTEYWRTKIARTVERDARARAELLATGWRTLILWECQLKSDESLSRILTDFLEDKGA